MEKLPEEMLKLPVSEKKRRLAHWLEGQPRGTLQQLAVFCRRTARAVSNWPNPQTGWISAELERKLWEFVAARSSRQEGKLGADFSVPSSSVPYPHQRAKLNSVYSRFGVNTEVEFAVFLGVGVPCAAILKKMEAWKEETKRVDDWVIRVLHHDRELDPDYWPSTETPVRIEKWIGSKPERVGAAEMLAHHELSVQQIKEALLPDLRIVVRDVLTELVRGRKKKRRNVA